MIYTKPTLFPLSVPKHSVPDQDGGFRWILNSTQDRDNNPSKKGLAEERTYRREFSMWWIYSRHVTYDGNHNRW